MHIFVYLGKIRSSNMQFFSINIKKFVVFNISFKCIYDYNFCTPTTKNHCLSSFGEVPVTCRGLQITRLE